MKTIFGFLIVALVSLNVSAADSPLVQHMKDLDKNYKIVVKQIANTAQNPSSIEIFQTLEKLAYECTVILPTAVRFNTADATARIKQILYMRMMSQLFVMILDGEEALQKNDNAAAKAVLTKMAELKFQGHQIFKP